MSIRPLSKELQEKAEKEINEIPSRVTEDLNHVKEWIAKQPHSQYFKREDQWILNHIRGCKFSLEKAKQKYNVFCNLHINVPEFFGNRDPFQPAIQEFFNRSILAILPEMNSLAPRRFIIQSKHANPEKIPFMTLFKVVTMIADIIALEDEACIINGQEVVFDFEDTPYRYITQITPSVLKHGITLIQNAFASRFVGIHFINVPAYVLPVVTLFKSLIDEKLKDRVHFYSENDIEKLYEFVPKSALPEEYGGNAGSIDKLSRNLKLKVESYAEWFTKDSQCNLSKAELQIIKDSLKSFSVLLAYSEGYFNMYGKRIASFKYWLENYLIPLSKQWFEFIAFTELKGSP